MVRRGVLIEPRGGGDLFDFAPAPPPAAPPSPSPGPEGRRYTDRENRRLEKVLEVLKGWLAVAPIGELERPAMAKLLKRFAPMQEWDLAQMIESEVRRRGRKGGR